MKTVLLASFLNRRWRRPSRGGLEHHRSRQLPARHHVRRVVAASPLCPRAFYIGCLRPPGANGGVFFGLLPGCEEPENQPRVRSDSAAARTSRHRQQCPAFQGGQGRVQESASVQPAPRQPTRNSQVPGALTGASSGTSAANQPTELNGSQKVARISAPHCFAWCAKLPKT